MIKETNKVVEKPWGREVWLALTDNYCFKRIEIKAGHKTSLQYHNQKEETNYLDAGSAKFYTVDDAGKLFSTDVEAGFFVHLPPGVVHCFEAKTDIVLMEASTIHVDDVVRLEDDYGRDDKKLA